MNMMLCHNNNYDVICNFESKVTIKTECFAFTSKNVYSIEVFVSFSKSHYLSFAKKIKYHHCFTFLMTTISFQKIVK